MQKWEYFILRIDISVGTTLEKYNSPDQLNRLGQDGWELTATVQDETGTYAKFIFKRPLN